MEVMLSRLGAVLLFYSVTVLKFCITKPCNSYLCNMGVMAFFFYFPSLCFSYILYFLLLYCIFTNCESFKSNNV